MAQHCMKKDCNRGHLYLFYSLWSESAKGYKIGINGTACVLFQWVYRCYIWYPFYTYLCWKHKHRCKKRCCIRLTELICLEMRLTYIYVLCSMYIITSGIRELMVAWYSVMIRASDLRSSAGWEFDSWPCTAGFVWDTWMGDRLWAGKPSRYNRSPRSTQPSVPPR